MAQKRLKPRKAVVNHRAPNRGLAAVVAKVDASVKENKLPAFDPGDTVKVHVRIKEGDKERIQVFEGAVIGMSNHGAGRSFTVRKISNGVGVERVFSFNTPKVAKVDVVQRGVVRRSKLYYLRELEGRKARIKKRLNTDSKKSASAPAKAATDA